MKNRYFIVDNYRVEYFISFLDDPYNPEFICSACYLPIDSGFGDTVIEAIEQLRLSLLEEIKYHETFYSHLKKAQIKNTCNEK